MSSLPLFCGNIISGYLMERFGRRRSQIILAVPFVAGWVTIGFATNIYLILFGRFLTGLCQGLLGPLGPVFIGEISTPIYRGLFLAALSLAIATGVLLSHVYGTFLHWSPASLLCGIFPLIGGIIIFYAPESPSWLASKGRIDECIKSFQWYRGTAPETKMELDKMLSDQAQKQKVKNNLKTLRTNLKKPEFWKPMTIMVVFFIVTQLSGVNVICAYTPIMMKELLGGHNSRHDYTAMLGIDVLRCVSLGTACVLLRRLGRRPMAIFSGVLTSISLIALAMYLYLIETDVINHISPFISLGLMGIYMIVSNLGIVPLPWNMVGELFATATKGFGSGISVMMTSIAFFGTVKTAPHLFESIGFHGTYFFYGISTLLGTVFLIFFLPETRGKTLLQVEEYFRYGKKGKTKESELKPLANV
ncbi:facilitated trehalose transporter Tret1 isoform X2 [Plutella xylostella]|nr:facilitated trehalose transporter Tret1 isoform X2 [Plutella xylostella]